jgi:hypothetical protein
MNLPHFSLYTFLRSWNIEHDTFRITVSKKVYKNIPPLLLYGRQRRDMIKYVNTNLILFNAQLKLIL